jgi:hypothetical protein
MQPNGRRYVQLAQSRGDAPCPVPNEVKVGVFLHSWCDAGLCGYYFILALAKTVTLGGSAPRERGRTAPRNGFFPAALPQSRADKAPTGFGVLICRIIAQKPVEGNCIYRPVTVR